MHRPTYDTRNVETSKLPRRYLLNNVERDIESRNIVLKMQHHKCCAGCHGGQLLIVSSRMFDRAALALGSNVAFSDINPTCGTVRSDDLHIGCKSSNCS